MKRRLLLTLPLLPWSAEAATRLVPHGEGDLLGWNGAPPEFEEEAEVDAWTAGGPVEQRGIATVYAARFAGRRTANGDRYDPKRMTAAHRTAPFGTKLLVTCEATRRSVVVEVNDRMGARHAVIDLSAAAAQRIGMMRPGIRQVHLRRTDPR